MDENFILQCAALVAAYVGVAKSFGLEEKWTHPTALLVAAVFVLVPGYVQDKITLISIIGLTASGAYQYVKKREDVTSAK
ncbi:membrane protein [Cohnella kolymensis]|uniref:Membrane protein n=1 Tax=Cohnella kolymensis TaxID=1590652 RepID=A0ABR5A4A4_9BACL|nr:hypothetical protein [Cohnella kolymensis]KIL35876.1 membrane protein [Cohnella kolymensis]